MYQIIQDIRFAIRRLRKTPTFALIAIISLALGIGANASIFSLVNTALLRPLPVDKPEQLKIIYGTIQQGKVDTIFSYLNYKDIRDRGKTAIDIAAYRFVPLSMNHQGQNKRLWGYLVSGNYFDVLGIKPSQGRWFSAEEDLTPGSHPVVVISYSCWQTKFGADPQIIDKQILINSNKYTVIAVAPKDFVGTEVSYNAEIFVPMMMAKQIEPLGDLLESRTNDNIFAIGRLKLPSQQVQSALQAIMQGLAEEYPNDNQGRGIKLATPGLFIPEIRESVIAFSWILMSVVGIVVLIACVNLANLLLARATERRKEIAVRIALGATRFQLIKQMLTESLLLGIVGGSLGLILSFWINDFVAKFKLPTDIPIVFNLAIDWRVISFTFILSIFTGIFFGLLPAVQASKTDLIAALKDETSIGKFSRSWLRNLLVIAQIALSLLLLVSSGLIIHGLQKAQTLRPGFEPSNVASISFDLTLQGYDKEKGKVFHSKALDIAKSLPSIESATLVNILPLSIEFNNTSIYIEGQTVTKSTDLPLAVPYNIYPQYFQTMGISLRGRDFTENDKNEDSRVAVVNETFASRFFSGQDAIGKRFNFSGPENPYWTIIGVCADGKYNSLNEEQKLAIYLPMLRNYTAPATLIIKTKSNPENVLASLRDNIQSLDPTLPLYDVKTLKQHLNIPLFPAKIAATILSSFAILALILAAIGIYGTMSYVVSQRSREMGIRIALGAKTSDILKMIVGQAMKLVVVGLGLGLIAAYSLTKFLSSLLYGVSATDTLTFVVVLILLTAIALIACLIPAIRAAKTDPMIVLRQS